jgi:hypothetical protein
MGCCQFMQAPFGALGEVGHYSGLLPVIDARRSSRREG